MSVNKLNDQTLFIGQTLVIPGVAQRAYPKPKPKPAVRTTTSTHSSSPVTTQPVAPRSPVHYSGGRMTWPVPGGFISQYYHYGHWAIDIAAPYGNPVLAAAPGVVTFAGWKNNGGGYQVWMSHGNGIYTTYNHMSAILVGVGQELSAGQQLGRIGATGDATGPHLHFEVWVGPIWDGGQRMNPLNYL
jgi:murein DD-endopeptidase MepM/ murein hydrolase activator NlpD